VFTWPSNDRNLQGRVFSSSDISFTGWYNFEGYSSSNWPNLFRVNNAKIGLECLYHSRILSIFHEENYNRLWTHYQTTVASSKCYGQENPTFPVNMFKHWMFVAESVTVGSSSTTFQDYYKIFGYSSATHNKTFEINGLRDTFVNSEDSFISIGDEYPDHGGINGRIADNRFYLNSALSVSDFASLYAARVTYCPESCQTCLDPFQCGTCLPGFYLSNDMCSSCNSCCSVCSGPGKNMCSGCIDNCHFVAPSTCLRCAEGCQSCTTDLPWNCAVCKTGFYMEFYSHRCVATCPTGFTPTNTLCISISPSATIVDLTFNQVAKAYTSPYFTIDSGAGSSSYPPRFSSDQPIPSYHRGLYFSGTQFLQLRPSPALLLSPSLTIETWIRPQGSGIRTIFAKYRSCFRVVSLRINENGYIVLYLKREEVPQ